MAAAAGTGRRSALLGLALVAPATLLMALLILLPAVRSLFDTVLPLTPGGVPFGSYARFFADARSVANLWFTVEVAVVSVALLLAIGLALALFLRFADSRLAGAIQTIALFPLFVPGIVASFALIRFLGPTGIVPALLKAAGIGGYQTPYLHPAGAVIGLVWEHIPLTVLLLTAGLSQIPDRAIEAARDVGAGMPAILLHIVLPPMLRSIVVAATLGFLGVFGAFTVPYILGPAAPQMMSIFMQRTFSELHDAPAAETQSAVSFLICLAVAAVYTAVVFRGSAERAAPSR